MHRPILVVDPDVGKCHEFSEILLRHHLQSTALHSLEDLEKKVQAGDFRVVILDLDALPVDNRLFRKIRKQDPTVQIVGLSSYPFHPELQEAMSQHICSCLSKPVDEEELIFWVKSLLENIDNKNENIGSI
jgi:DNA-binding NtrC family response regulator